MPKLLFVVLSVLLFVAPMAAAAGYRDDVPENLRSLVSKSDYDGRLRRLTNAGGDLLSKAAIRKAAASPCGASLTKFVEAYVSDSAVADALDAVVAGLRTPPAYNGTANPWSVAASGEELLQVLIKELTAWGPWLPQIVGDQDNGLLYIQKFLWLYYRNPAGVAFVQGRNPLNESQSLTAGFDLFNEFAAERGEFLDSPASTKYVEQWFNDPRIEIEDYQKQKISEYVSWNDFFSRQIIVDKASQTIPSRPVTMPDRDYIISAPTDCIVNSLVQVLVEDGKVNRRFVENPLEFDMVLDVKSIPISLSDLLDGVPEKYRTPFVGGSGLSCILMPNTYHHYHTPVTGTVVHAAVLDQYGTWGYDDVPNWISRGGDIGRPGVDFSQFSSFQRGVVIIEVEYANVPGATPSTLKGYVASIPVGLNTVGSVVLDADIKPGKKVKRGYTRIGSFYYGGSLNILLFSKGMVSPAVQSRMGNQIAIIDIGSM
jgi:phosphatidylserine decarboxylase